MRAEGAPEARNPQISPNLGSDQNLGFLKAGLPTVDMATWSSWNLRLDLWAEYGIV